MANAVLVNEDGPTIALALGGGGARGIAHVHVLEVLDELGIKPVAISGTSIGSIMGAGYASGMTGREVSDFLFSTFDHRSALLAKLWKMRPESLAKFLKNGGPRIGEIDIERVLEVLLPPSIPKTFDELPIPFNAVATDYYWQCEKVFNTGPLFPALAASAAIPAVFRPVMIDGTVYIDGGMTNPLPFDILMGSADIIIAVDVVGGPDGDAGKVPGKIDLMFGSSQLMMQSITTSKMQIEEPDILLKPKVNRFRVLDFLKARQILAESANVRDELKSALTAAIDFHAKSETA